MNLKKDSENTPVKGGIMADLGKFAYVNVLEDFWTQLINLLFGLLSDDQEDDFPGRVKHFF